MNPHLRVTMVQADLAWQDADENRRRLARHFGGLSGHTDLIVLPEMFSTGYSMNSAQYCEEMDGPTVGWMREEAAALGCTITGSLIIRDGDRHYNRLLWVRPDGSLAHYDKRHLFRLANEPKRIVVFPNARHSNVYVDGNNALDAVRRWIAELKLQKE